MIRPDGAQSPRLAAAQTARGTDSLGRTSGSSGGGAGRDNTALLFVAEMYGVQADQLAAVLRVSERRANGIIAGWLDRGLAEAGRLGPGPRWAWLTKAGLTACGMPYAASPPALSRLAHLRAVTAVRLALEAVPGYAAAGAHWRCERRLRARLGGRLGLRDHLPDAEVHWPDSDPALAWTGECWAIEVELTPKTVTRTIAIMRELLGRTGDYGCPAADVRAPGRPPRHARAVYLCSAAAAGTVRRARDGLGRDAARVEIRSLPSGAGLPDLAPRRFPGVSGAAP